MTDSVTERDDERERMAREDEERERAAQSAVAPAAEAPAAEAAQAPAAETPHAEAAEPPAAEAPADPPTLVPPPDVDHERREQADDENPEAIAEDAGYDALPARDHVSHGEAGADLVDEPGEPDVPAQEEFHAPEPIPAAASDAVFVEPPVEPVPRHNRLFGVGIVLLSSIVFAALYAGLAALLLGFRNTPEDFGRKYLEFLDSPVDWIPVIAYAVIGVLSALLVNRARWWAHLLVSLVAAILVWAVSVAAILLIWGVLGQDAEHQRALLVEALTQPVLIAAGFAARETLLWAGLGIAARGRRVVARNRAERADYEARMAESDPVWNGTPRA